MTSQIIFDDVTAPEKVLISKEELLGYVEATSLGEKEVFVTLGAGDIDRLVGPLAQLLTEKHDKGNA